MGTIWNEKAHVRVWMTDKAVRGQYIGKAGKTRIWKAVAWLVGFIYNVQANVVLQ